MTLRNLRTVSTATALAILLSAGFCPSDARAEQAAVMSVTPIAVGYGHSLAVAADGSVWQWGGDGDDPNLRLRPAQVSGLSGIVAVAAGHGYSLALKSDGTVWQWRVRSAPYSEVTTPTQVSGLADIVAVAAGSSVVWLQFPNGAPLHSLALKRDGTVWVWTNVEPPRQMPGLTGMIAIAAGYDHHLALRNDGTVWGWGSNTCGQAGRDPGVVRDRATNWSEAVQIAGISDAVAISAGGSYHFFSFGHSLALKADGSVWAWGCNDGFAVVQSTARQVSGLAEAAAVAAGGEHSLVVKKDDGTIWGWGWNAYGVLGDGTTSGCNDVVTTPVQASGLAGVVALSAGGYNNLAMTSDGTVWAWGGDYCCVLLDDGTTITRLTPAQVKGLPPLLMEPAVSAVISAASFRAEPVAPGQIVSVFGRQIGPAAGAISVPSSAGIFESTLAQTRVLFDGIAAPLLFAQAGQVNAVAPYALAGKTATEVQVEYRGVKSSPQKLAVAETAPGIFTVGASGAGQGMIFNEDGSLNSTSKPARRGSTVTLFATGEGQTSPPGVDGTVAAPPLGRPVAPVSLQVGGQEAEVRESVSAPGLAGVLQVKVRIPEAVTAGSAVPVTLKAGPVQSQTGVTVAVQ